jgi:hypothetical protein
MENWMNLGKRLAQGTAIEEVDPSRVMAVRSDRKEPKEESTFEEAERRERKEKKKKKEEVDADYPRRRRKEGPSRSS